MLSPLLSAKEVAQYLGIRLKTVHEYVRRGELGCIEVSPRDRRFTEDQLQEFIQRTTKPPKKRIDKKPSRSLTYSPKKGGAKSVKDSGADLREEIRQLWQ